MCHVKPEEEWPGSAEAESINDKVQERIRKKISARGYQELESSTKDALVLWVSANITEYVGDNPTSQDKQELKNWYLIWLALFPGIPVPSQPFFDGPSEASAEDERFLQLCQRPLVSKCAKVQRHGPTFFPSLSILRIRSPDAAIPRHTTSQTSTISIHGHPPPDPIHYHISQTLGGNTPLITPQCPNALSLCHPSNPALLALHLMLGHQKRLSGPRVQEIRGSRIRERDFFNRGPGAEDDHVGEIAAFVGFVGDFGGGGRGGLAEDAAAGEDGADCGCDYAGGGEGGRKGGGRYECNDAPIFEHVVEILDKFQREEINWLSAAREDVVDDVIVFGSRSGGAVCEGDCVFDDGCVGGWQGEVFGCEAVDDGVNFDDCGVDAVGDECSRGGSNTETA
ncbi:hypothetical protein M7I_0815 [Glarea lozoyensis 74030]|uniref:Uncharacterized protein n=1 Tax=Glarea lozoyensis (strain ATCC 74030 / MF5533) TaxID=1104152 RepID=H0EEE0_GLAL7|nr:hypothetical protein M7I_0815 [Glarea lozoyensis 74030]